MQNILALQAMELDATADGLDALAIWSTVSVACCTVTYNYDRLTTIIK